VKNIFVRHDSYQVGTAILAGEAYADSAVVDLAIKGSLAENGPAMFVRERLLTIRFLVAANLHFPKGWSGKFNQRSREWRRQKVKT
jgi:hypothetical protein